MLRTEGMGNIILNTYIIAGVKYEQIPQRKKERSKCQFSITKQRNGSHLLNIKGFRKLQVKIIKVIENAQANMK